MSSRNEVNYKLAFVVFCYVQMLCSEPSNFGHRAVLRKAHDQVLKLTMNTGFIGIGGFIHSSMTGSSLATCDRSQVDSTISIICRSIFLVEL